MWGEHLIISNFPGGGSEKITNASKLSITAGSTISKGDTVYITATSVGYSAASGAFNIDAEVTYQVGYALADIASGSTGNVKIIGSVTGLTDITADTITKVDSINAMCL